MFFGIVYLNDVKEAVGELGGVGKRAFELDPIPEQL